MRRKYTLSVDELKQFKQLRWQPYQNAAINFWASVANARGLDPKSVISSSDSFTALPVGHGKHWCYPMPLKCAKRPVYRD